MRLVPPTFVFHREPRGGNLFYVGWPDYGQTFWHRSASTARRQRK